MINKVDLRSVIDGMSEGFALLDAEFNILDVNAETLRLESSTRAEMIGRSYWELYPGSEHSEVGASFRRACQEAVPVSLEHLQAWPDGRTSCFEIRAYPIAGDRLAVFFRDVTDRYMIEQSRRESEQRFRVAVEAAVDVLWTNDAAGRMMGEQPGWAALTGQSYDEYQGYGWSRAIHPDDAQSTINAWNLAVSARQPFLFEHRVRRYDGEWRRFSVRALPVLNEQGEVREWVGVHTDITDQREHEQRFRQLAAHLECFFYIRELDGKRFSYVSPAYELIWKLPPSDLYADPLALLTKVHPDDRPLLLAAMERQQDGYASEVRYRLQHGEQIRHIHDRAYVMERVNGEPRRVVGIAEDVTVTTEARLQLARNVTTFETLVQNNPFGVYVVDENFRLVQASLGTRKVFGGIEPLIGRDFAEIIKIIWAEPFATDVIAHFHDTLSTGETYISQATAEQRQNIDQIEAYDWRIDRIALPHGEYGVVCYFYDLSERMALELELKQALDDKDILLREIDHRVRNSLSMVSSLLSMQANETRSPEIKQAIAVASARLQAVARVHERLYKSDAIGIVDFDEYLGEICRDLRASLEWSAMSLDVVTVPVRLKVDQAVPFGLIANELVTNAFKHCSHSDPRISVSLTQQGTHLTLVVADNGIGMPADYDPNKRTGLEMPVVKLLVRQLGGSIKFPAAGTQAKFEVTVPIFD